MAAPRNLYCLVPAAFTGDIRHLGGASILSKKYPEDVNCAEFVTVLMVSKDAVLKKA
jgi:hypothetical protein